MRVHLGGVAALAALMARGRGGIDGDRPDASPASQGHAELSGGVIGGQHRFRLHGLHGDVGSNIEQFEPPG